MWKRVALMALHLFVVSVPHDAFARDTPPLLLIVTDPSPLFGAWVARGCVEGASQMGRKCEVVQDSSLPALIQKVEDYGRSKDASGIMLEADNQEAADVLRGPLRTFMSDPLIVAWGAYTIEQAQEVVAKSGVRNVRTYVGAAKSNIVDALVKAFPAGGAGKTFCVVDSASLEAQKSTSMGEEITTGLAKLSWLPAPECPLKISDPHIFSQVIAGVADTGVKAFLLPYYVADLSEVVKVVKATGREDVIVKSSYASPFDLGRESALLLGRILPGETVPQLNVLPPAIQISSDDYCATCSCKEDARCGRECARCQK